jgi:tetratricopeptide (TPR) repeat protein
LLFEKADKLSAQLIREAGVQAATIELTLDVAARTRACGAPTLAARVFAESRSLIGATVDESRRQQYLSALVSAAARGGDFDLAGQADEQITDPMRSARARAAMVSAYLYDGLEQIDAALKTALDIPSLEQRIGSLSLIAAAQGRKGQNDLAGKTIQMTERLLQTASDDFKPWGYLNLAAAVYETGQRDRAGRLCDEAIRRGSRFSIHPERERALLYRSVGRLRASFGDEAGALATVKRSGDGSSFAEVAEEEARAGYGHAAMEWIVRLRDPEQRAGAMLGYVRGVLDRQQKRSIVSAHPRCQ